MERVLRGKEPLMGTPREPPRRCPRCESTNTKFCYFNNYSQSQPRHFCRACRRYWTEGGTLRNVPQGGGSSRRAKRPRAQVPVRPRELVDPPPMLPNLLIGGGGGSGGGEVGMPGSTLDFQAFHPGRISGTTMVADFAGFQACYDQACFNPTAPMPPAGFLNMPNYPQMPPPTPPPFDPSLIIASHQQMNITVFTTTTTTTTMTAAAATVSSATAGANIGIGGDLGFWNSSELNIHGDEGSSPPAPNPSDSN